MCIPRSLFIFTLKTLKPLNSRILERLSPISMFLTWPRCSGLFVFGAGYSITTLCLFEEEPYLSFSEIIFFIIKSLRISLFTKKLTYGPVLFIPFMYWFGLSFDAKSRAISIGLFFRLLLAPLPLFSIA